MMLGLLGELRIDYLSYATVTHNSGGTVNVELEPRKEPPGLTLWAKQPDLGSRNHSERRDISTNQEVNTIIQSALGMVEGMSSRKTGDQTISIESITLIRIQADLRNKVRRRIGTNSHKNLTPTL